MGLTPIRLLCIASDIPLPANSGGRVDVWRRLQALKAGGVELALLCWYDVGRSQPPSADLLGELGNVCAQVKVQPIRRSFSEVFSRLLNLWRMPSHAAARWVTTDHAALISWAQAFKPNAILLDGLYGGAVALWLSKRLQVPLLFRSHNIEHRYMREQYERELNLSRRLGLLANLVGLARFERGIIRAAKRVFDISLDDLQFWQAQGHKHVEWLPPLVDDDFVRAMSGSAAHDDSIDVLYFGNLNTPNNVDGVLWWLEKVVSQLRVIRPSLRICVAGSRPVAQIVDATARLKVKLVANPENMAPLLKSSRVLVNPVFAGSGVNIKTVEMLFSPAQLVSTNQGLAGLPKEVTQHFRRADTSEAFIAAVLDGLDAPIGDYDMERVQVRSIFVSLQVNRLIGVMLSEVERFRSEKVPNTQAGEFK
ncbi:MAG: glycosyltransferase [Thiobacillus sp.]|nr:glycosyltransferase [Thiobacillus sp.]